MTKVEAEAVVFQKLGEAWDALKECYPDADGLSLSVLKEGDKEREIDSIDFDFAYLMVVYDGSGKRDVEVRYDGKTFDEKYDEKYGGAE